MRASALALLVLVAAATGSTVAQAADLPLETFDEAPPALRAKLRAALYAEVRVLDGTALSPRPTPEARRRLEALTAAEPGAAAVHRYLARVLASLGEPGAATAALRRAEELEPEAVWPFEEQAAVARSRGDWSAEVAALKRLAARRQKRLDRPGERGRLADDYRAIADAVEAHRMPREDPLAYRRRAVETNPAHQGGPLALVYWAMDAGRIEDALALMPWARKTAPSQRSNLLHHEVDLLWRLERPREVRAVLERELPNEDGLEGSDHWSTYTNLLRSRGLLEAEARRARQTLAGGARGFELAEAIRLLRATGDETAADAALTAALETAEPSTDAELLALAALLASSNRADDASRVLTAVAATARGPEADVALLRLARLLARGHGAVGPSGVRALLDGRRLDNGPGLLSGALSLLLGGPPGEGGLAPALTRFDRDHVRAARAVTLVEELRRQRPRGLDLAALELELISTFESYGASGTAYSTSLRFLERYPRHRSYFDVGLSASRLARTVRQDPVPLLRRLAAEAARRGDDQAHRRVVGELARVLVDARRHSEAVAAYSTAIEARPEDVALFDALLGLLDRHNMHDETARLYERALARFPERSWSARYARWLLRTRGQDEHRALTRRLLDELGPAELAGHLEEAVAYSWSNPEDDGSRFFLEVYREALRRHPGELRLARRLLAFYDRHRVRFGAEARGLRIAYAPFDAEIRDALFAELASGPDLESDLASLERGSSAASRLLASDYLVRRAEHERARASLRPLVAELPGEVALARRLVELEESLGDRAAARRALGTLLARHAADRELLTRAGELAVADGDFAGARRAFDAIASARSGDPDAYLAAATLFWDYFLFDDATRTLRAARTATGRADLFAYQLAAVHESAGDRPSAVRESVRVLAAAARSADAWPPPGLVRASSPPDSGRARTAHRHSDPSEQDDEGGYDEGGYDEGGYDEGGYDHSSADPALVLVMGRLVTLAGRDGDRELVWRGLDELVAAAPDDPGLVHVRVDLLEATGAWAEAARLLAGEAVRLASASLRDRAVRRLDASGMEDEAIAVLERSAAERPLDMQPASRLVDYLTGRGRTARAAEVLVTLAGRLRGEEGRGRDLADVEARLARVHWGAGRRDEALAAQRRAIEAGRAGTARAARMTLARWLFQLERYEDTRAALEPVLAEEPGSAEALSLEAEALVGLGRAAGASRQDAVTILVASYERGITAARASARGSDDARRRVRALRESAVAALLELGAHRAVLDQQVLLLNDDLEDRQLLLRAYRHAAARGLEDNLVARYRRDAARSPRDHRLPLVLARLAAASGDLESAAREMGPALAVAPERTDLREEQVVYMLRRRDWAGAARAVREMQVLVERRGESPVRLVALEARLHGRTRNRAAMEEAIGRLVASNGAGATPVHLEASRIYAEAAEWAQAWEHAREHLCQWSRADEGQLASGLLGGPELGQVATTAVRAGQLAESRRLLGAAERAWRAEAGRTGVANRHAYARLANLAAAARGPETARALALHGVDADVRRFVEMQREELREPLAAVGAASDSRDAGQHVSTVLGVADLAGAAGSTRGQIVLLEAAVERLEGSNHVAATRHLLRVLESVGAHRTRRELAARARIDGAERLVVEREASAALGDPAGEIRALEATVRGLGRQDFDARSPELERLLGLRWASGEASRAAVPGLAGKRAGQSGQVVNFLLEKGDHRGAAAALERYAGGSRELWIDVARARIQLHRAETSAPPEDPAPFVRALDLRTIGERVGRRQAPDSVLTGQRWASLALPYGLALARDPSRGPPGARALHLAGLEADPRSPAAHERLGEAALARGEHGVAAGHFRAARALAPGSTSAADGLARALVAAGDRPGAVALWDEVLSGCEEDGCFETVLSSMVGASLAEEGLERIAAHVERQWRAGRVSLDLLASLARAHGARGREQNGPMDRLVRRLWRMDRSRLDLLWAAAGGGGGGLVEGRAPGAFLREALRSPSLGPADRRRWTAAYVAYLVGHREHRALVELLDGYEADLRAAGDSLPGGLQAERARGLIGLGRREEGLELLRELARHGSSLPVALLRSLGLEREANLLVLESAEREIDRGREERSTFLAATDALAALGRGDEAVAMARRGASARPDDVETLRAMAELLAARGQPEAALLLRRTVHEIERSDYDNLLAMARLELALGQVGRARSRALSLLGRWAVPAAVEDGAADLLVNIAAAQRRERRPTIRALEEALDRQPLDEDRALALARILEVTRRGRDARRVLDGAVERGAAPTRSLQLLARMAEDRGDLRAAEEHLERAVVEARGSVRVARQLFLVRRRAGDHRGALAALGITENRGAGVAMLEGLGRAEAVALCAEIAESAGRLGWWAAADAYASEAVRRVDAEAEPDRARAERARLQTIRSHVDLARAAAAGRPWITRGR